MYVLGIDPSANMTALSVISSRVPERGLCLHESRLLDQSDLPSRSTPSRLHRIDDGLSNFLDELDSRAFYLHHAAIEGAFSVGQSSSAAEKYKIEGVIQLCLYRRDPSVDTDVCPVQSIRTTLLGSGKKRSSDQVNLEIRETTQRILGISTLPQVDIANACAVAIFSLTCSSCDLVKDCQQRLEGIDSVLACEHCAA